MRYLITDAYGLHGYIDSRATTAVGLARAAVNALHPGICINCIVDAGDVAALVEEYGLGRNGAAIAAVYLRDELCIYDAESPENFHGHVPYTLDFNSNEFF